MGGIESTKFILGQKYKYLSENDRFLQFFVSKGATHATLSGTIGTTRSILKKKIHPTGTVSISNKKAPSHSQEVHFLPTFKGPKQENNMSQYFWQGYIFQRKLLFKEVALLQVQHSSSLKICVRATVHR